jgi:hypothetical protein
MSDPFKEFVEEMARLVVPEDGAEENQERREAAASESGTPISELDDSNFIACADDEFLCSETLALWAMIRRARTLTGQTQPRNRCMGRRCQMQPITRATAWDTWWKK